MAGLLLLAVVFPASAQPLLNQNATQAPTATILPRRPSAVSIRVVPTGSAQEAAVQAALDDALRQEPPPMTLNEVDAWSARLTTALRDGGFALGQVVMTAEDWQAAQTGVAVFTAFPGRIGSIAVENASRMERGRLERLIAQALCDANTEALEESACLFQARRFERATQLLQDLPGVGLDGAPQLAPGAGQGDVDVLFRIGQKGKPFTLSASVDRGGIPATGRLRATVGVSANNYFGRGEDYALSLTGTDQQMWTGQFSGGIPLYARGLRLTGGFSRQQYTVSGAGTNLFGVANTGSLGLSYPVTRGLDRNVWSALAYQHSAATVDYEDFGFGTHSTLDAAKLSVSANNGDRAQQLRGNQWSAQLALTAGRQRNDDVLDAAPQRAGTYAKLATQVFGRLVFNQRGDLFATASLTGQLASRNLDPSEKLGVGGPGAVRAYRPDEPMLDEGAVLNLGFYTRFAVAEAHQLQVGPFVDYAVGRVNHRPWAGWDSSYPSIGEVGNWRRLAGFGLEAGWLTPFGATLSAAVAKPAGFSDGSWIQPGIRDTQFWLTLSWSR